MNFENKYISNNIISIILLLLICIILYLRSNHHIEIYNNIIFKIFYLLLIYFVTDWSDSTGFFIAVIYIILDRISTYNFLKKELFQLEHYKQLEHYTEDYIIENNLN